MDIYNNLHGQLAKTLITKALTLLVEKGEISGKANGKQWVYVARQDTLATPSAEELESLDMEIESLKVEVNAQRDTTKQIQARSTKNQSKTFRVELFN